MRWTAVVILCAAIAAQDASASRDALASDHARVEFRPGLRAQALEIMAATAPARARVRERLGIDVGPAVGIVVVGGVDEMRAECVRRTGREPPDWAGGLALGGLDLVLIRTDLPGERFDRVDSVLAHELAHVALARATRDGQAALPRWFEEGLAQWVAGRARPLDVPDLRPAATFGYLLDLAEMNAAFARGEGAAARAYAQAESFVRFVERRSGADAIRDAVKAMIDGVEIDRALRVATGTDLQTSWNLWRRDLASDRAWIAELAVHAIVAALILLVVALGIRRVVARKRAIEQRWDADGAAGDDRPDAGV